MISFKYQKFCEIFLNCLEKKNLFPDNNYYKNIHDYIIFFYNDKEKINDFIKEILLIVFDGKNPDCLVYFFNQLNRKKKNI